MDPVGHEDSDVGSPLYLRDIEAAYPGEHAARQADPGKYSECRNKDVTDGVRFIYCKRRDGKGWDVQSVRFDRTKFTPEEARAWLKKNDFSTAGFEPASGSTGAAMAAAESEIKAACANGLRLCGASGPLELLAAKDVGGKVVRPFLMTAYTGAAMRVPGFHRPVVVDLAGLRLPGKRIPILRDHDTERIVGHTDDAELSQQRLHVSGMISGVGRHAQEVTELSDNGFPWQASVGADVEKMEYVDAKGKAKVNGRNFEGPVLVARASFLKEISFVALGADPATSAKVSAG
jgi:hypothetical protein